MTVNSMQVGGTHYKTAYEHWDLCVNAALGYLEGNATRYIARWRKKNGVEDLKKALHCTNKLLEVLPKVVSWRGERLVGYEYARGECISFCCQNKLTPIESRIVMALATWRREEDVVEARDDILMLMDEADYERLEGQEPKTVPATDSNKHALQDEIGEPMTEEELLRGLEDLAPRAY